MAAETPGTRLYLIRLACGDGIRDAEPAEAFVIRVRKATGKRYGVPTISRLERGRRRLQLEDAEAFAAVDPKGRGKAWLAFGGDGVPLSPPDASSGRASRGGSKGK